MVCLERAALDSQKITRGPLLYKLCFFRNYEGHGQSLLSRIPPRTCAEASIPEDYCACLDGVSKLDPKLPEVRLGQQVLQ